MVTSFNCFKFQAHLNFIYKQTAGSVISKYLVIKFFSSTCDLSIAKMAFQFRKEDNMINEIKRRDYDFTQEKIRSHIEEKHRHTNLDRYLNVQRHECDELYRMHREKEEAAARDREWYRENRLSVEMEKMKREEIIQLKLRQQLRENSPELRELERKLKGAYVNKELAAQIAQKEAERENQKIQEKRTLEMLKEAWVDEEELKKKATLEEMHKKYQYKCELQDQIILREKMKRQAYEEFLREKKMIDDIIQRIHDEDERAIAEKMINVRKTKEEIEAFKQARELWKRKKKEELEKENRDIQEYLKSKAAAAFKRQSDKAEKEKVIEKIKEDFAKNYFENLKKKKEREDIIQELMEEELKEADEKKHKEELERQIRSRIKTRESLMGQMEERQERKRQEAEENAKYKEEILAQLAEDQKLEQYSEQKRRMKMLQLKRDVEKMLAERRQKQAEEMQLSIRVEEQERQEAEQRRRIVEQERINLLQEHVKNLIGFLPKGLLKPEDLAHLGGDTSQ